MPEEYSVDRDISKTLMFTAILFVMASSLAYGIHLLTSNFSILTGRQTLGLMFLVMIGIPFIIMQAVLLGRVWKTRKIASISSEIISCFAPQRFTLPISEVAIISSDSNGVYIGKGKHFLSTRFAKQSSSQVAEILSQFYKTYSTAESKSSVG